ncbi:unnamed protein product [Lupinus luteus]|uniref:Uncharacterized protein n=1 Tax=Lupinus luteus TaxID=3873 RepID=A0AAV1VWT9_LUPLU
MHGTLCIKGQEIYHALFDQAILQSFGENPLQGVLSVMCDPSFFRLSHLSRLKDHVPTRQVICPMHTIPTNILCRIFA